MTPEYLSTHAAAQFCGAPNAKAFRERMRRRGIKAGTWGSWNVEVLRALMAKSRRRKGALQSLPSRPEQGQGSQHGGSIAFQAGAQVHAQTVRTARNPEQINSVEGAR